MLRRVNRVVNLMTTGWRRRSRGEGVKKRLIHVASCGKKSSSYSSYSSYSSLQKRYMSSSSSSSSSASTTTTTNSDSHFDICILGCGAAGFAAAARAWDFGRRVAVVNSKEYIGGATIHNGALASKLMWQMSRQFRHANETGAMGNHPPSFNNLKKRVKDSVAVKHRHYIHQLSTLGTIRYSQDEDGGGGHVVVFDGYGRFTSPKNIQISKTLHFEDSKQFHNITADYFLIATGSQPRVHPKFTPDHEYILTSDDIPTKLDKFPSSILIYGGGVIGCEFATIFSNYGATKPIYLFNEYRERLLPEEDEDLTSFLTENLESANVNVMNRVVMRAMELVPHQGEKPESKYQVKCVYDVIRPKHPTISMKQECEVVETKTVFVDKVLLAIGRVPNINSLRLKDVANVKINDRGTLEVDEHLRSVSSPHIYAAGDALGKWGLVSVAEMEGRHTIERIFGTKNPVTRLDYKQISSVMFVRPEIACVGMNEKEAMSRNICFKSGFLRFGLINRAVIDWCERHQGPIEPKKAGFIKMICTDDEEKTLLGMRAVGVDASSVIGSAALLIRRGDSIRELEKTAHPHPAIIEGVQECARLLLGRGIYKPHVWAKTHVKHYSPEKGSSMAHELLPKRLRQMIPGYMEA